MISNLYTKVINWKGPNAEDGANDNAFLHTRFVIYIWIGLPDKFWDYWIPQPSQISNLPDGLSYDIKSSLNIAAFF